MRAGFLRSPTAGDGAARYSSAVATPAPRVWPYAGRTVAEIDAAEINHFWTLYPAPSLPVSRAEVR